MAYGGSNKQMDTDADLGRDPGSKHQIQPECRDEQADAGRDYRNRLARPFSGANGYREIFIFLVQMTTSRIGDLTRLIHTLAICDDHTVAAWVYDSIIYSGVNKRGRDVYCIVGVLGKSSHTL